MTTSEIRARDSLPGLTVGERYIIDDLLAEGGMGCVYRAYDQTDERMVAIKVLQGRLVSDPGIRRRFLNEARTTMRIESPNVIEITDLGELDDGSAFYVMDYLEGNTLDAFRIDTFDTFKAIALQICSGLQAAHDQGVVHRDLKPENVMVVELDDGAPQCRLIDFGIAKLPFATIMTMPGQVLGTPAYIAPEQAKAGAPIDHRSDIYALGCLMFELVTGTLPFDGEDPILTAMAHITQPPPPLADRAPECPAALAALIMRCLEKDPAKRYQTVRELVTVLQAIPLTGLLGVPPSSRPLLSTVVLFEDPGIDCDRTFIMDRRKPLPVSVSDLLNVNAPKYPTPPGPQPWQSPEPLIITQQHAPASAPIDWMLWSAVGAATVLALAAAIATSLL